MPKQVSRFLLPASLIFFISSIVSNCNSPKQQPIDDDEYRVQRTMVLYQRYSHKLYLAGKAGNWGLAEFYEHELEELTADLTQDKITYEGKDLGALSNVILRPAIDSVGKAIQSQEIEQFRKGYNLIIKACNNCHLATEHDFINITIPSNNPYNQQFQP